MRAKILSIKAVKRPQPRFYAMTGTPVSESPNNAYALLRLIDPTLACSKAKFDEFFIEYEDAFFGGAKVQKVKGYKNLDKLQDLMATICIRRETAEGMPEVVWQERPVELGIDQKRFYNEIARKAKQDRKAGLPNDDVGLLTLRHCQTLVDPSILGSDAPSAKLDELELIAEEVLEDPMAKMVVWCSFAEPFKRWKERFKQYKPVVLDQNTGDAEMARMSKTFDLSNERMVFLTPQKGGTGLDWLSRARYAVYVDEPWSLIQWQQSKARIQRRTNLTSIDPIERLKGTPARIMWLRVVGTPDDLKHSYLERKEGLAKAATSITIDDLKVSLAEMDQFMGELK